MWNLKGGIMQCHYYENESAFQSDYSGKRIDWMAGLEMEIPLGRWLNIETGARYKKHYAVNEEYDDFNCRQQLEVPLRLAYKQPLGRFFSLHAGVGPYGSWAIGNKCGWDFKDNVVAGLEPSIAINWKCLSLGATYNIPCFYEGYKDINKPVVMATLGIRFESKVWKYVGIGLLAVATVGTAVGAVLPAFSNNNYSSRSSSYNSYGSSESYSGASSSSYSGSSSRCKFCGGSGKCSNSLSGKNRCRGTGKCNFCNGQKYQYTNGHPHECGACHGSGKCSFCGGTGICKHCNGTGK